MRFSRRGVQTGYETPLLRLYFVAIGSTLQEPTMVLTVRNCSRYGRVQILVVAPFVSRLRARFQGSWRLMAHAQGMERPQRSESYGEINQKGCPRPKAHLTRTGIILSHLLCSCLPLLTNRFLRLAASSVSLGSWPGGSATVTSRRPKRVTDKRSNTESSEGQA
jgi:hypothetical protein